MNAAKRGGLSDQQKKLVAGGVFAALFAGVMFYELRDFFGGPPAPPPAAVIVTKSPERAVAGAGKTVVSPPGFAAGRAAQKVGTASVLLDPTLRMGPMLVTEALVYSGTGRNIFAAGPVVNETKIAAVRLPPKPLPQPIAPVRPVYSGPPPLPAIGLKFFGTAMRANGDRRALLLHGEDVFLASAGDVVDRRYKVISIAANSIVVEDLPNSNRQTLPLLAN